MKKVESFQNCFNNPYSAPVISVSFVRFKLKNQTQLLPQTRFLITLKVESVIISINRKFIHYIIRKVIHRRPIMTYFLLSAWKGAVSCYSFVNLLAFVSFESLSTLKVQNRPNFYQNSLIMTTLDFARENSMAHVYSPCILQVFDLFFFTKNFFQCIGFGFESSKITRLGKGRMVLGKLVTSSFEHALPHGTKFLSSYTAEKTN